MERNLTRRAAAYGRDLGLAALLAVFVANGPAGAAEPPGDGQSALPADIATAIAAGTEAWIEAYEEGDVHALAAQFTEDGLYAANTGELLRGRAGIRDAVLAWADRRRMILEAFGLPADSRIDFEEQPLRVRADGDAVYRLSRFMILVEPSRCVLDAGHALAVWRRQVGGGWRIESLIANRDRRPPDGACGRTREAPE